MINFKTYFNSLLLEINENTILYHRSTQEHQPGDTLTPSTRFSDGHWLQNNFMEQKLEDYRKENYPDKPSRLNCVYASVVPRSVFLDKGNLYKVKPIGNFHVTLAYYIDKMNDEFHNNVSYSSFPEPPDRHWYDDEEKYKAAIERREDGINKQKWYNSKHILGDLFEQYWAGKFSSNVLKDNPKWIEVLCEQVVIVGAEEDGPSDFVKVDDEFITLKDIELTVSNRDLNEEKIDQIKNAFSIKDGRYNDIKVTIPKGTTGTVDKVLYHLPDPKKQSSSILSDKPNPMKYRYVYATFPGIDHSFYMSDSDVQDWRTNKMYIRKT